MKTKLNNYISIFYFNRFGIKQRTDLIIEKDETIKSLDVDIIESWVKDNVLKPDSNLIGCIYRDEKSTKHAPIGRHWDGSRFPVYTVKSSELFKSA